MVTLQGHSIRNRKRIIEHFRMTFYQERIYTVIGEKGKKQEIGINTINTNFFLDVKMMTENGFEGHKK